MTNTHDPARERMERLISQMPKMADAVNAFNSPEIQREAFNALLQEYRGAEPPVAKRGGNTPSADKEAPSAGNAPKKPAATNANGKQPRGRRGAATVTGDKNLDLYPKGVTSFEDFVTEKQPGDNFDDHNVVTVYWLKHVAELENVTADQVYTCFRSQKWNLPSNFRNRLQKTASEKNWLNTKKATDLTVTSLGINHVEHQLPPTGRPGGGSQGETRS